jgi:hypothetical protein
MDVFVFDGMQHVPPADELSGAPSQRDAAARLPDGEKVQECIYSQHSLRSTTATLLLDSSVAIESV